MDAEIWLGEQRMFVVLFEICARVARQPVLFCGIRQELGLKGQPWAVVAQLHPADKIGLDPSGKLVRQP